MLFVTLKTQPPQYGSIPKPSDPSPPDPRFVILHAEVTHCGSVPVSDVQVTCSLLDMTGALLDRSEILIGAMKPHAVRVAIARLTRPNLEPYQAMLAFKYTSEF